MSTNVGAIDLELLLNSKNYSKQLKNIKNISNNTSNVVSNSLSKIGKAALAAFSVKKIFDFGKECINLGSDLAEVQNVVDVSFKTMNQSVNQFAQNAIEQFGLGQTVAKRYMGTFGAMSKAFGFAEKDAYAMSETLTGLAGDVASFYNLSSDLAYTKLKSVFTGETETLKDLGVVMTQNALDQYALANGYGKTTAKMSEQEKVALRFKFVTDQLSVASGDFVRTQDSWANQTRVLSLRFNELKATLGQGFINLFAPIVKGINLILSKLQVLANAFKSFSEFITGNKSDNSNGLESVSSDLTSISENANDASGAVGGIGNSAKKAAKDLKSLATFDTAQILKSDKDDSSAGSSGVGGGISGLSGSLDIASTLDKNQAKLNPFIERLNELAKIFKEGFNISFGDTNFDGIIVHLQRIKAEILDMFNEKNLTNSIKNWQNTLAKSLGKISGGIARIGVNVIEGFIGSIDKYLSQNTGRIRNFIYNMFNISSKDIALKGSIWQAMGEISDIFKGDIAKQIGADIIAIFSNPFMSIAELINKFKIDLESLLFQPIIDNTEKIKVTLQSLLEPVQTVTGVLANAFTYAGDKMNEVYNTSIEPLFESLKTGLSDTFSKFLDLYNEYVVPFLNNLSSDFETLWEQHLKPFTDKVGDCISSIVSAIQTLWEVWLKPLIDWAIQNIIPIIIPIFQNLWNGLKFIISEICTILGGLLNTLKGVIDFVSGVFAGDWSKAWNGIKTIFEGCLDTIQRLFQNLMNNIKGIFSGIWASLKFPLNQIVAGIEKLANAVIKGINSMTSALNNMSFDVPDWVPGIGGGKFGFNIPRLQSISIPRLYEGGFFKANQPTLAMVGDNKRQAEIVSPMNKMEEAFENVLNRRGLGDNQELVKLLRAILELLKSLNLDFNLFIDGKELEKRLERIRNKNRFATNGG